MFQGAEGEGGGRRETCGSGSDPVIELSDAFSSSPVEALQAVNEEVLLLDADGLATLFFFSFVHRCPLVAFSSSGLTGLSPSGVAQFTSLIRIRVQSTNRTY